MALSEPRVALAGRDEWDAAMAALGGCTRSQSPAGFDGPPPGSQSRASGRPASIAGPEQGLGARADERHPWPSPFGRTACVPFFFWKNGVVAHPWPSVRAREAELLQSDLEGGSLHGAVLVRVQDQEAVDAAFSAHTTRRMSSEAYSAPSSS